jgi:signal transduction histidine kinase
MDSTTLFGERAGVVPHMSYVGRPASSRPLRDPPRLPSLPKQPAPAGDRRWARLRTLARHLAPRTPVVPLGLVTMTLIALVAVPLAAEWYTRPLFDQLRSVTAPAQQLLTRVHVALAIEGSTLRDFVETDNPALAARYRSVVDRKTDAQAQLGLLVDRLGPLAVALLQHRIDTAHAESRREQLYEKALIAAARLDEALDDAVQSRRSRIREAGRLQRVASVVLSALALLALAAVGWLARRLRTAASDAEQGRRAVEHLMESKARLMRGVSHDLKNPINAIDGYAALLVEGVGGVLSVGQRQQVERIRASARSVLALVGDLLELSRADVGQLHVACQPTDVRAVVLDTVEEHRGAAQAASHILEAHVLDALPQIETDPVRVRQVLGNLLSNAIKYTPAGGRIDVEVEMSPGDTRESLRQWLAIHVTDTGPGIPPSQLETVFEEFTRLDRTGQRGSGLGLAIARRVARLLGGDLTLRSEVGHGSRFTLWLPK